MRTRSKPPILLDRLGEHQRGREGVGAVRWPSSTTWTRLVGAHRSALRIASVACSGPTVRTVTSASPVAASRDLQRLLDGVLVELGEQPVDADPVDGVVGLGERAVALGVRHVLDTDDDVHDSRVLFRRFGWFLGSGHPCSRRQVPAVSPVPCGPTARCYPPVAPTRRGDGVTVGTPARGRPGLPRPLGRATAAPYDDRAKVGPMTPDRSTADGAVPGALCLVLHSHLPWLQHHGVWPLGEEWLHQAWVESYVPLVAELDSLAAEGHRDVLTLGVTPVLAAQLDDPARPRAGAHLGGPVAAALP